MKSCRVAVGCVRRHIESELRQLIIYILCAVLIGIAYSQNVGHVPRLQEHEASDTVVTAVPEEARVAAEAGALRGEDDFSLAGEPDSILADTARTAISRIDRSKVDIETAVSFSAKDSLVLEGLNNAYLYGDGTVEYQDFKLNSAEIRMELDSSTVYAAGVVDTAGVAQGRPVFKDKSGEYESETMKYNFKTERGYITGVITEQDEGFLQGGRAKRMDDGSFYVEDGKYTTCDDHEHPHFYFQLTRAKVRPDKDVVTGPAYMVLADVPLPLALPFGYFPFSKKYSSGVIFPSFGDDYNLGFYLRDGGYYFAINDNVDLALTGEIYTKGSWGLSGHVNYVKRYRYRGNFDISFLNTQLPGHLESFAGCQGQSQPELLSLGQFRDFRIFAQRPQLILQFVVYGKHQVEHRQHDLSLPWHEVESVGHCQHHPAFARLDAAGFVPQPYCLHVADRTFQTQEVCRRREVV